MSIQENVVPFEAQRATVLRSDRLIGAILIEDGKLTASEVENVLELQRSQGMRFGECAVRLGYISDNDVRFALAKQYDFPHLVQDVEAKGHQPSTELGALEEPFHSRAAA